MVKIGIIRRKLKFTTWLPGPAGRDQDPGPAGGYPHGPSNNITPRDASVFLLKVERKIKMKIQGDGDAHVKVIENRIG